MVKKIAVIGKGNVGGALQHGLEGAGFEVRAVGNDPDGVRGAAAWGELIIVAVPYPALDQVAKDIAEVAKGKTVIDASNAVTADFQMAVGFTTSAAEELQKHLPGSRVVKAFNTVFAQNLSTGQVKGTALSLFVAGDDAEARGAALGLGKALGFDGVDAGPLQNARWIEALGYLNIQLGYMLKMGTDIGFKLIH